MRTAIVVDDEPITRTDLSEMLSEIGFSTVGEAADGFDAIELCRTHHPDVVIMDIKMPVFDGLSASDAILHEDLAGCVVLLTAFSTKEFIDRANEIGVTGYLVKPVEQRLLLPTLEVALAQSERLRQSRRETEKVSRQLEDSRIIYRAQGYLAREKGVRESDAYRMLQQMSMEKGCTMAALAKTIVQQNTQKEVIDRAKEFLMKKKDLSEAGAYRQIVERAKAGSLSVQQAAKAILEEEKER